MMAYFSSPLSKPDKRDVVFVLNHGNIVTDQNYDLIYSETSMRSFTGDHLDYYCLQVERFEFQRPRENEWVYGPEENSLFSQARSLVASVGDMKKCFNGESDFDSKDIAAKIWAVETRRENIQSAVVILYHKPTHRILYVSLRT
jgi:hypothetical protein